MSNAEGKDPASTSEIKLNACELKPGKNKPTFTLSDSPSAETLHNDADPLLHVVSSKQSNVKLLNSYLKSELIDTKSEPSSKPVSFNNMENVPQLPASEEVRPKSSPSLRRESSVFSGTPAIYQQPVQTTQQQHQYQPIQQLPHTQPQSQYILSPSVISNLQFPDPIHTTQYQQYPSSHNMPPLLSQASQFSNMQQLNTKASVLHHLRTQSETDDNQSIYPSSVVSSSMDMSKKGYNRSSNEEEFIYNNLGTQNTSHIDLVNGYSGNNRISRKPSSIKHVDSHPYAPSSYSNHTGFRSHGDDELENNEAHSIRSFGRLSNYPGSIDVRSYKNNDFLYPNQYVVPNSKTPLLGVPKNNKSSKTVKGTYQLTSDRDTTNNDSKDPAKAIISQVRKVSQRLFSAPRVASTHDFELNANNIKNERFSKPTSARITDFYSNINNDRRHISYSRTVPDRSFSMATIADGESVNSTVNDVHDKASIIEDNDNDNDDEDDTSADLDLHDPNMFLTKQYHPNGRDNKKYYQQHSLRSYGSVVTSSGTFANHTLERSDSEDMNYRMNRSPYYNYNSYDEYSPHDFKPLYYRQNLFFKMISNLIYLLVILFVGSIAIRVLISKNYGNQLSDFKIIAVDKVIMSDDLLIFELNSCSHNYNFQDITIWDMNMDVFLLTNFLKADPKSSDSSFSGLDQTTILLGNSESFTIPLEFNGIFSTNSSFSLIESAKVIWKRVNHRSTIDTMNSRGQVKIANPGKSARSKFSKEQHSDGFVAAQDGGISEDQWRFIINNPFTLIIRGSLEYRLPLISHKEIISVSKETQIIP